MEHNRPDEERSPKRRSVLKGIASGLTVGAGLGAATGPGGARRAASHAQLREVATRYDDPRAAREAVAEHATDLLALLAQDGVIETASVAALGIDAVADEPAPQTEFVVASAQVFRGTLTGDIHVAREVGGDWVDIHVLPEAGRSYAVVRSGDSETRIYDPGSDGPSTSFSTQDCIVGTVCKGTACLCNDNKEDDCDCSPYEIYCCGSGSCYFGNAVSGDCCGVDDCAHDCCEACNYDC